MKRELVLGTLIAAGGFTLAVAAFQQPPAGGAQQPAAMVVEVDKLKDNLSCCVEAVAIPPCSSRPTA